MPGNEIEALSWSRAAGSRVISLDRSRTEDPGGERAYRTTNNKPPRQQTVDAGWMEKLG